MKASVFQTNFYFCFVMAYKDSVTERWKIESNVIRNGGYGC